MTASVAHRARLLRAMGVVPMRLRVTDEVAVPEHGDVPSTDADTAALVDVVLVIPADAASAHLDLLGRAMTAFGARFARAARLIVADGAVTGALPAAKAYLAFGEAQARALGRDLDAEVMASAEVVLLGEPERLVSAQGKRQLWVAVNTLRRRWRPARIIHEGACSS